EEFRQRMLKEYHRFWNEERLARARSQNLDREQVITLASIVQKETARADERPRVAGVYLNRLRKNILLQADPTVIYAIKKHTGDFDTIIKRVLYKDLEIDSPYNTYKYAGLPPGPIAMPDISSIDAVLAPEKHDYYYFVANINQPGYHKFSKTLSQHNANKQEYVRWLNDQKIHR
ncbi:endolytic transglycosylase MltG, partial [Sinomicrobium weinanense]